MLVINERKEKSKETKDKTDRIEDIIGIKMLQPFFHLATKCQFLCYVV